MSLEFAILGFLNYRPMSGYDLKKIFDTSVRHFWPADQAQIYRTLGRMAEKGLVSMDIVEQSDRPDRKVYRVTRAGSAELQRWLLAPPPMDAPRSAPMIQVFFAGQLTDDEALKIFERARELIQMGLTQYENIPHDMGSFADVTTSPREFWFWMLTLQVGIHTAKANLAFIEEVIRRIKAGEVPPD